MHKEPRGIRNNNPGNIEQGQKWQGLAKDQSSDSRFAVFTTPEYGIRALAKLLGTYQKKYGLRTLTEVINRYAPTHENKTDLYITNLCKWSGFSADDALDFTDKTTLYKIVPAVIRQENGYNPYTQEQIRDGINLL